MSKSKKEEKLLQALLGAGLSENEAKVYLAAMRIGSANPTRLASAAEIKRTTVYPVIESLRTKGLMDEELRGFKKYYFAESPERLNELFEKRKTTWQSHLPDFMAIYHLPEGSESVRYYRGMESIKAMYESLLAELRPHDEYLVISDTEKWLALDREYFTKLGERRAKLRPEMRILTTRSKDAEYYKTYEKNFSSRMKFLPESIQLTSSLTITPKKLILFQMTEPVVALVIENQSMVQMQKELFEILWDSLPKTLNTL